MLQRLQYVLNMPSSKINCYNVTVLEPIHGLKVRKNMLIIISYYVVLSKGIARYTDVTIVTVHFYMPSLRIECYGVTALLLINVQKV